ncbi:undecaprenyldiphospho-muramoylpentapeptide beta-N-acetylglucosaminyltransferase [Aliidiomarina sp. Khilg15.8]
MSKHVLILAGGTGGHVFPALAVAQGLAEAGYKISWSGTMDRLEARVVPAAGFDFYPLEQQGLRGRGAAGWLQAPWRLSKAVAAARTLIKRLNPDLVLGFGGYTAGPGGVAARLCRIPLMIHEQNAAPGMTNKLLARIAQRVLVGFESVQEYWPKAHWVGNPVRQDIVALSNHAQPQAGTTRVLVVGGSLGAQILNETVPAALAKWRDGALSVTHQVGKGRREETLARYQQAAPGVQAEVTEFIENMAEAYAHHDIVICRAGALTIAELACAGIASILVPYPYAVDDHQTRNAEVLVMQQAAVLVPQQRFTAEHLVAVLEEMTAVPKKLQEMGDNARKVAVQSSTQHIVRHCQELLNEQVVS